MTILLTSGEAALALGVSRETIETYTARGKLQVAARTQGGMKLYTPEVVEQVKQTREAERAEREARRGKAGALGPA